MAKTKVKRLRKTFKKTRKNKRNKRTLKRKYNKRGGAAPERDECPICLENDDDEELCTIITCGHKIHAACYDGLPRHSSCPICRRRIMGLTCGGIAVRPILPAGAVPPTAEQLAFYEQILDILQTNHQKYEEGDVLENNGMEILSTYLSGRAGFPVYDEIPYVIPLNVWNQATGNNLTIQSHDTLDDLNHYLDEHDSILISDYYDDVNDLYVVIITGD